MPRISDRCLLQFLLKSKTGGRTNLEQIRQNYYGNLCTEMYEILHSEAPSDELDFYLSYAEKGKKILEPLCGSGRFLVPFLERGFTISGIDLTVFSGHL